MKPPTIAEPSARIFARIIDFTIWAAFWVINGTAVSAISGLFDGLSEWRLVGTGLLTVGCIAVYEFAFTGIGTATLGKRALQVHVETVDGFAPGLAVAALRTGPMLVLGCLVWIPVVRPFALLALGGLTLSGMVLVLVDPQRRTVWDRLSKSVVVKTRR